MIRLDDLNEKQQEAVRATEGPLLVLAGAGTGKTRVITYRVAYLLEKNVPGDAILAVTFTNKAANVMKERIADLLRSTGHFASDVWIFTFHSFCARLLRREADAAGLASNFTIYDDDDQTMAVKAALKTLGFSAEDYLPRNVRAQISHAKNHGISPEDMESEFVALPGTARQDIAKIFREYQKQLQDAEALDFDDLLLEAVKLLRTQPAVRDAWSSRFRYLMVDEFQDTNAAQEELVRLLAGSKKNVCVVGDEDQSIYGWRGARSGNLKRFTEDFPEARLIRLEENYRSTQTILDAAAAVVRNNSDRLGKTLCATLGSGMLVQFFEAQDASAEAQFVCDQISPLVRDDPDARIAVLYRTTAQSRSFEEVLRRLAIRYRVVGGMSFYERSEIRTALSYVRLLFHPNDNVALLRVLNVPSRGIGATTIAALESHAKEAGVSLWEVICAGGPLAGKKPPAALQSFRGLIEEMQSRAKELTPALLIEMILDRTGLLDWVEQKDNIEHTSRAENLRELSNAMAEATEQGQSLEEMLDLAALVSDSDQYDASIPVSLMTLHSAKGLEFDAVFLAGLEEGLLPHSRSLESNPEIEEERRLFYVGMTRAKKSLTLTRAIYRRIYGEDRLRSSVPSRFLSEVPMEFLEAARGSLSQPGESRRYESDPEFQDGYQFSRASKSYGRSPARPSSSPRAFQKPRSAEASLIGTRVRHPTWGLGTITGVDGEGEDRRLFVNFQDYGPKKLVERYANLQFA
jgi:DNA helicase-2/ATP-dependent DNA helicase PcrA